MNKALKLSALALAALALGASAPAQTQTIDFDTLATPATGVGPSQRVYQEYGAGGFTILRIADPSNPSTYGNHFHTVAGNGSAGHSNTTAAEFFSDDGSPIQYYWGDYTGTTNTTYAAADSSTWKTFSLTGFTILSLSGTYALTASNGSVLNIDHAGTYSGAALAGFQNIRSYRHDYTGATDGYMVVDDIRVQAVPEPAPFAALGLGALALVRRRRAR